MTNEVTKNYVLYHAYCTGPCTDGLGAAYAIWTKYGDTDTTYLPVSYGKGLPEMELTPESRVFIVDFSYPMKELKPILNITPRLYIIDHHKTAAERFIDELIDEWALVRDSKNNPLPSFNTEQLTQLKDKLMSDHQSIAELCTVVDWPVPIFDMTKSGAVLAWEYLYPVKAIPSVLLHVQDRDLWQWEMKGTKELLEGMRASGRIEDFSYWHEIANNYQAYERTLTNGRAIVNYQNQLMEDAVAVYKQVHIGFIGKLKVAVINTTVLMSEIAERLYNDKELNIDYAICYAIHKDGTVKLSFRSHGDSAIDVSAIAKQLGGGGHFHAAGANLSFDEGMVYLHRLYTNNPTGNTNETNRFTMRP